MQVTSSVKFIGIILFATIGLLIFLHISFQALVYTDSFEDFLPLADRFNVDLEQSIPTWFSQTLLFVAAILLFSIGAIKYSVRDSFVWHWLALGAVFLYFSLDEGATLHETLNEYMKLAFTGLSGPFYFAWVIPFGILVCVFVVTYIKFLGHLSLKERVHLVSAGLIYVIGALGMEMVGGQVLSAELPLLYYVACFTLEELFELVGCALLVTFALQYMSDHKHTLTLKFKND